MTEVACSQRLNIFSSGIIDVGVQIKLSIALITKQLILSYPPPVLYSVQLRYRSMRLRVWGYFRSLTLTYRHKLGFLEGSDIAV